MIRRLKIKYIDVSRAETHNDISIIIENAIAHKCIEKNIQTKNIISINDTNLNDENYDVVIYYNE